jgi:hypothetical protein
LLLTALSSSALTLGRPRGALIIGQPLDVSIPLRVDVADDSGVACYEADVFHGDARIGGGRVTVGLEPGASPQDFTLRVRSSAIIDEPVVTLYIRAGCVQRSTRRYVLLADVPSEVVPSITLPAAPRTSVPGSAPVAAAPPTAGAVAQPAPGNAASSGSGSPAAATPPRQRRTRPADASSGAPTRAAAERQRQSPSGAPASEAAAPALAAAPARPARAESVVRRPAGGTSARSRLKLDPLDLLVEVDPVLRSSPEIVTPITENPQARAEAAALWRAINAQPQDILRDAQKLQGLEADVKALREMTARNQASITDLSARLQKAQDERYANGLVFGLVGLLLAALAAAGFFWWRARNAVSTGAWWQGAGADGEDLPTGRGSAPVPPSDAVAPPKGLTEVDVDLGMDENLFASLKSRSPVPPPSVPPPRFVRSQGDHSDFGVSLPGISRAVNAEELFDIQQQADFFMSLGQHDQAIEVLKTHIADNVETSALAYLDLLKIYHSLDRRDDYAELRSDFNRRFNAQVPPFDSYTDQSNGLEAYRAALSRIEALWPSRKVLEVIEESIFRKPGTGDGEAFDLEAYRELLLLYAIAKDVVDHRDGSDFEYSGPPSMPPDSGGDSQFGVRPTKFSATSIQPLSAVHYDEAKDRVTTEVLLPEIPLPRPSPRLGLDIDLSEPAPASAFLDQIPPPEPVSGHADFSFDDFTSESLMGAGRDPVDAQPSSGSEPPAPAAHSNLMDFDLFDEATEAEISPAKGKIRKSGPPG